MNLAKAVGVIEVFPVDRERIKKKKKPFEEQTIVLKVDDDLSRLYGWFIQKQWGLRLEYPSFGSHVTINNGMTAIQNVEAKKEYLKCIEGRRLSVEYDPDYYRIGDLFAVRVYSAALNEVRQRLELPVRDFFHITIGRIHSDSKKTQLLMRKLD